MTDEDLLHRVAELLFGPSWQTPLAAALGLNLRTVQRWASGERPLSAWIWVPLAALVRDRGEDLRQVLDEIERHQPNLEE